MSDSASDVVYEAWRAIAYECGVDEASRARVCEILERAYAEVHRHYHTLEHIASMLDGFESIRHKFTNQIAAVVAILFHDVVYDPARNDNETRSAAMMRETLGKLMGEKHLVRAVRMIEATKAHDATGELDVDLVLDLDMAILGASWERYLRYARGVWCEFVAVYGEAAYRKGRVELFLRPMCEQKKIFLTEPFHVLNQQAVTNMRREITLLREGGLIRNKG